MVQHLPDVFQGNFKFFKISNDILKFRPIVISPTALMETKSVVLLHRRQSNGADLILLGYFRLRWTGVEGQINTATQRPPDQLFRPQQNLLPMSVPQEDTMGIGYVFLRRVKIAGPSPGMRAMLLIDFVISRIQIERVLPIYVAARCEIQSCMQYEEHTCRLGLQYPQHTW